MVQVMLSIRSEIYTTSLFQTILTAHTWQSFSIFWQPEWSSCIVFDLLTVRMIPHAHMNAFFWFKLFSIEVYNYIQLLSRTQISNRRPQGPSNRWLLLYSFSPRFTSRGRPSSDSGMIVDIRLRWLNWWSIKLVARSRVPVKDRCELPKDNTQSVKGKIENSKGHQNRKWTTRAITIKEI
jgi:hypothetical protein